MNNKLTEPIVVEVIVMASKERLWNALTQLDQMKQWYFPMLTAFEPRVGFRTRFTVQVEDRIYPHQWEVTEVREYEKISYQWTFEGYMGKAVSCFELSSVGDSQCKLVMTNSTLQNFPSGIPEFKRESAEKGWNYLLKESLVNYLKTDK